MSKLLTPQQVEDRIKSLEVLLEHPSLTDFIWHMGVRTHKLYPNLRENAHTAIATITGLMQSKKYRSRFETLIRAMLDDEEE